jgi:hypothetical protein
MSERIFEALMRSELDPAYTVDDLRQAAAAAASVLKEARRNHHSEHVR